MFNRPLTPRSGMVGANLLQLPARQRNRKSEIVRKNPNRFHTVERPKCVQCLVALRAGLAVLAQSLHFGLQLELFLQLVQPSTIAVVLVQALAPASPSYIPILQQATGKARPRSLRCCRPCQRSYPATWQRYLMNHAMPHVQC